MASYIGRRKFLATLGGAAAAWPLATRAQQPAMPVIGFLWTPASPPAVAGPAFRQGLNDTGFIEGQNVAIEYRFAEGQYDRLPDLLAELIRQKPMVIVAPGSTPAALAAKAATTTIPILFSVSDDPVKLGLVASLNRPHSNATGVNFLGAELGTKQLGLLRELLPSATRVGVLVNPKNPVIESWLRDVTEGTADTARARRRGDRVKRREFITLLGGAAAAWPLAARAQQTAMPVVGYFDWDARYVESRAAFRQGLADAGYVEGRNVAIEYRSAEGEYNRLRPLAADLVGRQVSVILATGMMGTALAAKAVTATIPIVVAAGGDPVKYGLAASLNRPGGNVTGMTYISSEIASKRLDLLHKMAPQVTTVAYLSGGPRFRFDDEEADLVAAANALGLQIIVAEARSESDIEAAFASLVQRGAGALIVGVVAHFTFNSRKIVGLADHNKIPAIYPFRNYVRGGGLMSYGANMTDTLRQVAVDYVGRILKGANPADLPIAQPTKFPLTINLKSAKTLGLEIPSTLLVQADEVIE